MKIIVFTDLDATLLDAETYSWQAAREAIDELKRREASIILVSSKTLAEMEPLHRELELDDPFIIENGGGVVVTQDTLVVDFLRSTGTAHYPIQRGPLLLFSMGAPYSELTAALAEISAELNCSLRCFSSMTDREIASATGLSLKEAGKAKERNFDEPFLVSQGLEGIGRAVQEAASRRGLTVVLGGRFRHLIGHEGKGKPVQLLIEAFRNIYGPLITIGLGDSPNDFPFLELVDRPILVGTDETLALPTSLAKARRYKLSGPEGWNTAILELLSSLEI